MPVDAWIAFGISATGVVVLVVVPPLRRALMEALRELKFWGGNQ